MSSHQNTDLQKTPAHHPLLSNTLRRFPNPIRTYISRLNSSNDDSMTPLKPSSQPPPSSPPPPPPQPSKAYLSLQTIQQKQNNMLLLHQTGSVKIGEIVRYTITYTPAHDRILPSPTHLHLKIKNTSAIALRAAFVHGPYTLYVAAYPSTFHPDEKFENPRQLGVPEFEPNLKAGGTFSTQLKVPEDVRAEAGTADRNGRSPGREGEVKSVSWVVEVTSQVIFSNSAAVHFEVLLGRDERSLSLGLGGGLLDTGVGGAGQKSVPGKVGDHLKGERHGEGGGRFFAVKGVFSRAIRVKVDDTASLWNTPRMPEWDDEGKERGTRAQGSEGTEERHGKKRQKKVHLVVLTHGLHSNLGADMLYLKESIDAASRQAKIDARVRRAKRREERRKAAEDGQNQEERNGEARKNVEGEIKHPTENREDDVDSEEDDEEVIVRGFSGNAVRTERGIKYLGKRLAKYVLQMTYPDQPYKPTTKKSAAEALSHALKPERMNSEEDGTPSHSSSTIVKEPYHDKELAYKFTSISFIAHSLGGLTQTYAVAYIQKHSPEFFDLIKPINFIALASPFLGLSNENPLYVKFALDFGLVGRSGQDLGLTWRAPTIARSGWGAIVGGIGESASKKTHGEIAPESKPLLRILPTGPAHVVLKKFRNRTVYSNVVNDGIVPLRTSCLLFLDWQGLGRVEKARRENGLVGTLAGWGWAEVTGANSTSPSRRTFSESAFSDSEENGSNTPTRQGHGGDVPQPPPSATRDDNTGGLRGSADNDRPHTAVSSAGSEGAGSIESISETTNNTGALANILKFFQPAVPTSSKSHNHEPKSNKIYKRSQTIKLGDESSGPSITKSHPSPKRSRGKATTGDAEHDDPQRLSAPPKTTFFESAGDLLKPPLPSVDFLIDPTSRPRTIFHDRVYHPSDIPPPPLKKRPSSSLGTALRRRTSLSSPTHSFDSPTSAPGFNHTESLLSTKDYDDTANTNPNKDPLDVIDGSAMRVEEKIARAYHKDLSWRKVLVRLEPDAHNNMIVRRMFANAYGWPVVKHLCDTHFSDTASANMRDENESNKERAKSTGEAPNSDGGEVREVDSNHGLDGADDKQDDIKHLNKSDRTDSEIRESRDEVPTLKDPKVVQMNSTSGFLEVPGKKGSGSAGYDSDSAWSERDWADSEFDTDDDAGGSGGLQSPKIGSLGVGESLGSSPEGSKKGGGWNWTEAIVGKGRPSSPRGTDPREMERFLGKGSQIVGSPVSDEGLAYGEHSASNRGEGSSRK